MIYLVPVIAAFFLPLRPLGAQRITRTEGPAWTKGATCYEVFVRSFFDSDGDGIGDINGLTAKLDYINDGNPRTVTDLGARCIWLMPVAESPSYHGYDVTNYYKVEPDYGTNDDFKRLVAEAHRRGIRIIIDMVINHASAQHPFFQEALRDTASAYRSWFIFQPRPGPSNRWGNSNWHQSALRDEYYYGFFWGGMPDLNYRNPGALEEMKKVATFWLTEMGVDGFRLDAIRHLIEDQNGAITENVPATHAVIREYAGHVRRVKPDAFTIGEVWDSTGALLPYYPDQLDAYFAFEVADSIVSAVKNESAKGLLPPILRLQAELPATRWSPFLRNHDQPRTRTELGGSIQKARVASFLLLTMPGIPFVYYGEELGMAGSKPDERLRTPMPWTAEEGTAGFTTGTPWQALQADASTLNVAELSKSSGSILSLHRKLIHLRSKHHTLGGGRLVPMTASTAKVAAYLRRDRHRAVLAIANLSATTQRGVTLSAAAGALPPGRWRPRSLLTGESAAPIIGSEIGSVSRYVPLPALLPYGVYLFDLQR